MWLCAMVKKPSFGPVAHDSDVLRFMGAVQNF